MSDKKKAAVDKKISLIARNVVSRSSNVKPEFKTKAMVGIMRMMQKNGWNKRDVEYWKEKGWLDNECPWKR